MTNDRGFSLIELVIVVAVIGIIAAMATPVITDVVDGMRLGNTAREVERELQTARLKSVQSNRDLQVRTNCPAAGQYRLIEVGISPAIDSSSGRCSATTYPFPAADTNPATRPNFDGPVRRVYQGVTLSNVTIEFHPDGTAYIPSATGGAPTRITGTGVSIIVTKKTKTRSVTVNGLGKIQLQ